MDFETNGVHFTCHNFNIAEMKRFRQDLDKSLSEGTLTYDQLFAAICTIDDGSEGCIPYSMGTEWFVKNARSVAAVFGQAIYRWFLLDCGAAVAYYFAEAIAIRPEVFMAIEDPAWREAIASELYLRHGAVNFGWMKAFQAFLNRDRVAELLLERLELAEYDPHTANDIGDFLRYGDRGVWPFLTSAELIQAFRICANKAPSETLDALLQLDRQEYADLRVELAGKIQKIGSTTIEAFRVMDLEQRRRLIRAEEPFMGDEYPRRSVAHFVRLAVDTAFDLPDKASVVAYLREIFPKLEQVDPAVVFRNARAALRSSAGLEKQRWAACCNWVNDQFDIWLARRDDIFLGVVTEGRHRGQRQLQVVKGGVTYIHDRYAHRYFPQVGHRVLIKLRGARQLTPTVRCVVFLPVNSTEDVY